MDLNTINWPLIILGLPSLFLVMSVSWLCATVLPLDLSKHVLRNNVSGLRLRPHDKMMTKIEAGAWLEAVLAWVTSSLVKDEYVQNEVRALLLCQDHRVCELRKDEAFLAAWPYLLHRSTTTLFMTPFLSITLYYFCLFLSLIFSRGWPRPFSSPISQTTWLEVNPSYNYFKCGKEK